MGSIIHDNPPLRLLMVFIGVMTILYNLHNYLLLDVKQIIRNYFGWFTHRTQGKQQLHRLYNIFIMYPVFYYVYQRYPTQISTLFLLNIVIGFIYNLFNFIYIMCQLKY